MSSEDCERVATGGDRAGECEGRCMQKQNPVFPERERKGGGHIGGGGFRSDSEV